MILIGWCRKSNHTLELHVTIPDELLILVRLAYGLGHLSFSRERCMTKT